ncbi:MAG: AAA family ATPase, partial [Thermoplasmata archaeon]
MILRSLSVKNIRSYVAGTVALGPGTTLLTGDVGAGKTSLLYAAEMALFGFAEVEAAYLVRNRARHAEVTLELEDGEHRYEFRRKFRRKTVRGRESFEVEENSFGRDGSRIQYSATELRQRSIDLLGFPDNPNPRAHSDVWRWAVYIPQERMRDVLGQETEARLDTVRKALGLEQFRVAADNAQEVASELRRIAEMYEREAEQLRFWVDEVPRWSAERATRARELEELGAAEVRCRGDRDAGAQEVERLEAVHLDRERDRAECRRLRGELQTIERAEAARTARMAEATRNRVELQGQAGRADGRAEVLRKASDGAERLRAEILSMETQLRSLEPVYGSLAEVDGGLKAVRLDLERLDREITEGAITEARLRTASEQAEAEGPPTEPTAPTPLDLPSIERELARARAEREALLGRVAARRHETSDLSELLAAGTCPRCHQHVAPEQFEEHFRVSQRELAGLEEMLARGTEEVARREAERSAREGYERALDRYRQLARRRAELRAALESEEARRTERTARQEGAARERERLEARRKGLLPVSEEVGRLRSERDARRASLGTLEGSLAEASRLAEEARGGRGPGAG